MTELYATEVLGLMHELWSGDERHTLLECSIDGIAHKEIILGGNDGIRGQQRQKRLLHCIVSLEFGHYLYPITGFERQLIFNLEDAERINLVAKEIDTIRVFATIRIYIENGATQGKLTWFVYIVDLVES